MTVKLDRETEQRVIGAQPSLPNLPAAAEPAPPRSLRVFREEAEAHAISQALDYAGWNRRRAAQLLGISYRGLLYKIRQYNLTVGSQVGG